MVRSRPSFWASAIQWGSRAAICARSEEEMRYGDSEVSWHSSRSGKSRVLNTAIQMGIVFERASGRSARERQRMP